MSRRQQASRRRRHRTALIDPLEPRRLFSKTIYVDLSSPGPFRDGTSWTKAYTDLQQALSAAVSGDMIRVARGTYKPTTTTSRTASFVLKDGVSLYGGYAGAANSASPDLRNASSYATILSGDIGVANDSADNCYHVVFASGLTTTPVFDGFTVTAGNADGILSQTNLGGGLCIASGHAPAVSNCTFLANAAATGGAVYCRSNSALDVANCAFVGNVAQGGSAVYDAPVSSASSFVNCSFVANAVTLASRGAIDNLATVAPVVTNCLFWGNTAPSGGGSIYNASSLPARVAVVTYCDIEGGYAGTGNFGADPLLARAPAPGADGKWATADDDYGDLRLRAASPCVDAGSNAAVPGGLAADLAGNPRLTDLAAVSNGPAGWVDVGAYEVPPPPVVTLAPSSARVYESGGTLSLVLQFSNFLNEAVTVPILVTGGTADAADYSLPASVTVPVGQSSATIPIGIVDDQLVEPAETLVVSLGAPANAVLGSPSDLALTILDNDLLYVDARAAGGAADGSGWANAFTDLQAALAIATKGTTVRVATGTYRPTATTARSATFSLKSNVSVLGGYAGLGAPDPDARDIALYPTTLSGDIGVRGSNADNSYHVVTAAGVNTSAVLDGFTVTAGNANASTAPDEYGGGLYSAGGSPSVRNCTFTANAASIYGGAIYAASLVVATTFANCTFTANTSLDGGAIYNNSSLLTLANCVFTANSALNGGAIFNESFGGGNASVRNCTFIANTANQGGAINNSNAYLTIAGCAFVANSATDAGGAVLTSYWDYVTTFSTITGCTFVANSAASGGGAMINIKGSPKLTNSVFWANAAAEWPQIKNVSSTPVVTYCDVQGGYAGQGNLDADPLFVRLPSPGPDGAWGSADDDFGDVRLSPASPCVDAGSSAAVPAYLTTDLTGNPRFLDVPTAAGAAGVAVDLGAYEAAAALAAAAGGPYVVLADQPFALAGRGASDVAGDLLYAWDWTGDGLFDDATGASPAFPAGVFAPGVFAVALRVTDAAGRSTVSTSTVRVLPRVAYVDARAAAAGDGTGRDWANAFASLADALAVALPGQTIRVGAGTYRPTATAYRTISFSLKNGVALYGGYAGYGAASPDVRDVVAHPTVLSGDIGVAGSASDNTYHVIVGWGADATAVLDGFTVTAGNADGAAAPYDRGGALYDLYGAPTVRSCTFVANAAAVLGGAVYNYYGGPATFTNCAFVGNTAAYGAAFYTLVSSPVVANCVFVANAASAKGGAVENDAFSSPTIVNSVLWGNTAPSGPQIDNNSSTPTVSYSDIQGGYAGTGNLASDPKFFRMPSAGPDAKWGTADDDYGDLRLLPGSPGVDAGSNAAIPAGVTADLAGNPRTYDFPGAGTAGVATVDMGAYELTQNLGALHVPAGRTVALPAGGYAFSATQVVVDPGGTLDLADDSLLIDYTGVSPLAAVRAALASGRNGGAWNGTGIVSSVARTTANRGVGYAEAADLGLTAFAGQAVDATALLLKYTIAGDANLDGRINGDDYALADRGRAKGLGTWVFGDFDYNAAVTNADYAILNAAAAPQPAPAATMVAPPESEETDAAAPVAVITAAPAASPVVAPAQPAAAHAARPTPAKAKPAKPAPVAKPKAKAKPKPAPKPKPKSPSHAAVTLHKPSRAAYSSHPFSGR